MRLFLKYISLFSLIIFGLCFVADRLISNALYKSKSNYYFIWNDLLQGKIKADIVMYGSSRARLHINPKIMEDSLHQKAYNLGIDGYNFHMMYARHSLLLERNQKPKIIILSLDYYTLEKRKDLFNYDQFLPYLQKEAHLRSITQEYNGLDVADYLLPLKRYFGRRRVVREAIQVFKNPALSEEGIYQGFQAKNEVWNDSLLQILQSNDTSFFEPIDESSITLLKRFLRECKEQKIQVLFVYSPEYILGQKFAAHRSQMMAIYKKIANEYQILMLDYSDDLMCKDQSLFFNSQHLNEKGAHVFSKKLAQDVKNIGI